MDVSTNLLDVCILSGKAALSKVEGAGAGATQQSFWAHLLTGTAAAATVLAW